MGIEINVGHHGVTTVDIDGSVHTVNERATDLAVKKAYALIAEHARTQGESVQATYREGGRSHWVEIHPDGTVLRKDGGSQSDHEPAVTAPASEHDTADQLPRSEDVPVDQHKNEFDGSRAYSAPEQSSAEPEAPIDVWAQDAEIDDAALAVDDAEVSDGAVAGETEALVDEPAGRADEPADTAGEPEDLTDEPEVLADEPDETTERWGDAVLASEPEGTDAAAAEPGAFDSSSGQPRISDNQVSDTGDAAEIAGEARTDEVPAPDESSVEAVRLDSAANADPESTMPAAPAAVAAPPLIDSDSSPAPHTPAADSGQGQAVPAMEDAFAQPADVSEKPSGSLESAGTSTAAAELTPPAPLVPLEEDEQWQAIAAQPATQGWRGALNSFGMSIGPGETELDERRKEYEHQRALEQAERYRTEQERLHQEQERRRRQTEAEQQQLTRRLAREQEQREREREQRALMQKNFDGVRTIVVANPKGGSRKTTSSYMLAATLGMARGGSVIAWDANETMGSLGARSQSPAHQRTVVDLLDEGVDELVTEEGLRLSVLDRYVRGQGDCHFDVLASDEDPTRETSPINSEAFDTVHEVLARFYRIIIVDTGNNIRAPHFSDAIDAADLLVIPVTASHDSVRGAKQLLLSLRKEGKHRLIDNAVVLLQDLEEIAGANQEYLDNVEAFATELEAEVPRIVPIPYDRSLQVGDQIDIEAVSDVTRRAYSEAAATVAEAMHNDSGAKPPRR